MPAGGTLGIYCTHAYAQNTPRAGSSSSKALPGVLKGADMAVYAVFRALGLQVRVRSVMTPSHWGWFWNGDEEEEGYEYRGPGVYTTREGLGPGEVILADVCADGYEGLDEICRSWAHDKVRVRWLTDPALEEDGLREATVVHATVSAAV